jgi:hypothetical protein
VPGRTEPGVMSAPRLSSVRLVAVVPAWMFADGEYGDLAVGGQAEFGFALESERVDAGSAAMGIEQAGEPVPTTTVHGSVISASPNAPVVIDAGTVKPIVTAADASPSEAVSARGRLVVEPFLWATDGVLWPTAPDGVRLWSVDRIRAVTGSADVTDLLVSPPVTDVDHEAVYLIDLSRPDSS